MFTLKQILVATDFSEPAEAALLYGKNFARQHGAALHVLHVVDDAAAHAMTPVGMVPDVGGLQRELEEDAERRLADLLSDEDRRRLRARTAVKTSAWPASAILTYAKDEQIDLIIIGTHGRTGIAHFFMGSVAQHVVRSAPCPVLTLRHPEREFVLPDALQATPASDVVKNPVFSFGADGRIGTAVGLLRDLRMRRMPVTDKAGVPIGVLSIDEKPRRR